MAKSKNGGSRAFVRGRIGSDVYSIGKDGKGTRQQVVRSLAVQVANPRTTSQMIGRMLMSTVMQAVSELKPIIDHSFDGYPKGQPSISQFIRLNYARIKNYYDNIADGEYGSFCLNKYQEKGCLYGSYQISDGEVAAPASSMFRVSDGGFIDLKVEFTQQAEAHDFTFAEVKAAWPFGLTDKITMVAQTGGVDGLSDVLFQRVSLNLNLADSTVITADNAKNCFVFEGNCTPNVLVKIPTSSAAGYLRPQLMLDSQAEYNGLFNENVCVIRSKNENGVWKHSPATFNASNSDSIQYRTKEAALATYPVGSEQFLNGGTL